MFVYWPWGVRRRRRRLRSQFIRGEKEATIYFTCLNNILVTDVEDIALAVQCERESDHFFLFAFSSSSASRWLICAHKSLFTLFFAFFLSSPLCALNFLVCIFRIPPTIPVRVFILGGILSCSPRHSFFLFFFFFRSDSIWGKECYLLRSTSHSIQNRAHTHTAHRAWKTLCNKWLSLTRLFLFVSSVDDDKKRQRKSSVLLWLSNASCFAQKFIQNCSNEFFLRRMRNAFDVTNVRRSFALSADGGFETVSIYTAGMHRWLPTLENECDCVIQVANKIVRLVLSHMFSSRPETMIVWKSRWRENSP